MNEEDRLASTLVLENTDSEPRYPTDALAHTPPRQWIRAEDRKKRDAAKIRKMNFG